MNYVTMKFDWMMLFFYWIESSNLNVPFNIPEVVHSMTWDLDWRFKIYAVQLCIFTEVISLVPQLQCVKKRRGTLLNSASRRNAILSKGVMLEWQFFFFKKQIYDWYSFDYIIWCGISGNLSEQESCCQNCSMVVPRV